MRFLPVDELKPGMIIAKSLYDSYGHTLIGTNNELTENYIKRIVDFGFSGVYIEDELSKDIIMVYQNWKDSFHQILRQTTDVTLEMLEKMAG